MLAVAYYLLKVIICSGILYGYYRLALHNKLFHRWNRFYLLSAIIISISFPLIKININHNPAEDTSQVIKLLNVVTTGDEIIIEANGGSKPLISSQMAIAGMYIIVSLVLLIMLLYTLYKLYNLIKQSASQYVYGIRLVNTEAKGTPFSFFSNIFWNNKIDIETANGERIFKHELAHVQEKHSADKIFINIVLIFYWCNPFFWLIRREMNMIHEFIADSKAVEDNDTSALAAMIVQAAYPQHHFGLTSSFFTSSIKRRILMLTKMQNPSVNYISRVLALPLLTFVFVAFTIKTKQLKSAEYAAANITIEKPITVVIDAGHGGEDPGAKAQDGTSEKAIALSIVQKIKELNTNKNIHILLSRETDVFQNVRNKVEWALQQKPDAFVSIHVNTTEEPNTTQSGFSMYISRKENPHEKEARLLGSYVANEIGKTYTIDSDLKQRNEKGIWVLDAPDLPYPSLLIQCGYINNKKDLAFITNTANQEKIAKNILDAIAKYAKAKDEGNAIIEQPATPQSPFYAEANSIEETPKVVRRDSLPKNIKSIDFTKDDNVIVIYNDNKFVKMTKKEAIDKGIIVSSHFNASVQAAELVKNDNVIYVLNGKETTKEELDKVDMASIASINIIKGKEKKADIIDIKTTNDELKNKDLKTIKEVELGEVVVVGFGVNGKDTIVTKDVVVPDQNDVYRKVEVEATFPGGDGEWSKYISREINRHLDAILKDRKTGTCVVQFIVGRDGSISNVEALTLEGTKLAEIVVDAIAKGPKWNPAMQDGKKVRAYRKQPVTFMIAKN